MHKTKSKHVIKKEKNLKILWIKAAANTKIHMKISKLNSTVWKEFSFLVSATINQSLIRIEFIFRKL